MLSKSSTQTKKIAAKLAAKIAKQKLGRHAKILALQGNLGAGKTTFIQGFAKALGIKQRIISPTFLIFRRYSLRDKNYKNLYHFDLYRVHSAKDILALGFRDIISEPSNIVLIEWPEKVKKILPKKITWIKFDYGAKENERIINMSLRSASWRRSNLTI